MAHKIQSYVHFMLLKEFLTVSSFRLIAAIAIAVAIAATIFSMIRTAPAQTNLSSKIETPFEETQV